MNRDKDGQHKNTLNTMKKYMVLEKKQDDLEMPYFCQDNNAEGKVRKLIS
jgi:hypothetical protein